MRPARSGSWATVPPPAAHTVWRTPWTAACADISSRRDPQERPHASMSGAAAITSSAWTPIEPVEPSTRMRFIRSMLASRRAISVKR